MANTPGSEPQNPTSKPQNPTLIERALNLFAEVKGGEGFLALLLFVQIFLILNAYYVLKPIRDSLIGNAEAFGVGGDELKAYLSGVMAVLLVGWVRGYGALASSVTRQRLLNLTSGFIVVSIGVFFVLLGPMGLDGVGIAVFYFVWLGIVNVFVIAQFWSFANDIYTQGQGKRLFPVIAIGQSLGAIAGAWTARKFGQSYTMTLLALSGGAFFVCQIMYNVAVRRVAAFGTGGEPEPAKEVAKEETPMSSDGSFGIVVRSRYLLSIALMILVANMVNSNGEFIITNTFRAEQERLYPDDMYTAEWAERTGAESSEVITAEPERKATVSKAQKGYGTTFFGNFYFWVNLLGALIQMFVVSRFFRFFGVRSALFVLPVIATMGNMAIGVFGTLIALQIAKTAENATDYSLQNTLKQALFLPATREEKYKAKSAIDTFFVRLGDTMSAAVIALGTHVLMFGRVEFAFFNVALGAIWLGLCLVIAREHKKKVPDDLVT